MSYRASLEIDEFLNLPENLGKQLKTILVRTEKPVDVMNGEGMYVNMVMINMCDMGAVQTNHLSKLEDISSKDIIEE
jgi:hypothetical protein